MVLEQFKAHCNSMKQLCGNEGDDHIQTTITSYMKSKAEMTCTKIPEDLQKQLKIKPNVLQGEGTLDPKEFHFGYTLCSYEKWLDEEAEKHRSDERCKFYMQEMKPFLLMQLSPMWTQIL